MNNIQLITKEELIGKLKEIETRGCIRNTRNCIEYFHYNKALMLKSVNLERFIDCIEQGKIYIDFDARTGHNHGTKFRIKSQDIPLLYKEVVRVV